MIVERVTVEKGGQAIVFAARRLRSAGSMYARFLGARGGAPKGAAHGMYKHGRFTCEAVARRRALNLLLTL